MRFTAVRSVDNRAMKRGGFTLVELMIALLIMGILLTAIYRVFISQESMFRAQEQAAEMQENVRATSEFLHQELSWLGYDIPDLAIRYAGTSQIIYKANLPNTGGTDSFIRYTFDATNERIMRAVETTLAAVQNDNNLKVLANDVDSLTFSYFDGFGAQLTNITAGNPAVSPTHDNALSTIRRIRSTIVVKSARPDWNYTHPTAGDNFRRRSAVVEVKTRNVEDISVVTGGGGTGTCSSFLMDVTYPVVSGKYSSCSDQQDELATATQTVTDNPLVTVTVVDPDGNPDDNTPVSISADYGHIFKDSGGTERSVITGRTGGIGKLYLAASSIAVPAEGTQVTVNTYFTPPEAGCLQLSHTETLTITSGTPSRFDTLAPYNPDIQSLEYVLLDTGNNASPQPATLPICSSASNIGAKLKVRVEDDCNNGIDGETVDYSVNPAVGSFQAGTQDNGDGTYSVVYIPPSTITTGASSETVDITAQWTTSSNMRTLTLTPGSAYDMVVNSIVGPVAGGGSPLYGFITDGSSSFEIERVSNQNVTINFSVLDACGNRVFGRESYLSVSQDTPGYGVVSPVSVGAGGTYTATWTSNFGCGAEVNNLDIDIVDSGISGINGTETIAYDLRASTEPVLNLSVTKGGLPIELTAGCTGDELLVAASIQEFSSTTLECSNVPGPFPVTFSVLGKNGGMGNGSFDHGDLSKTTEGVTSDSGGIASVVLNPGTSTKGQVLVVSANVDIEGATYAQMEPEIDRQVIITTTQPGSGSGFYEGATVTSQRIGLTAPSIWSESPPSAPSDRSYDVADNIWIQIDDCDENENVFSQDGFSDPKVRVILSSNLTGDAETVSLIETGPNTASFRNVDGISTVDSSIANSGDGILQTGYGDLVTMEYTDNDDGGPVFPLQVFISGTREVKLFKVDTSDPSDLSLDQDIVPGASQITISDGDWIRPRVYIPEYGGVGGNDSITATLTAVTSPGESDSVTFVEISNDGYFYLDADGQNYFEISSNAAPGSVHDHAWLELIFTPQTVTLSHDTRSVTIDVDDSTGPDVSISSSGTSGDITITVDADDGQGYAPTPVGINQIAVSVNGTVIETKVAPPDLTGSQAFTWTTASGGTIYWLDGNYTVQAVAYDLAGNTTTSSAIGIELNNGGNISFTSPTVTGASDNIFNDQTLTVGLSTSPLGTGISVALTINGSAKTLTSLGGDLYSFDWDTSLEGEGAKTLLATLDDGRGNTESATALNLIIDRTPPSVSLLNTPPSNGFYGDAHLPITWEYTVTDLNYLDTSSLSYMTITGTPSIYQAGTVTSSGVSGGNYVNTNEVSWSGPLSDYEGSAEIYIEAYDSSNSANLGSLRTTINIDTQSPTVDAPVISGAIGSYVKGTVTVSSTVTDTYTTQGSIGIGGTWYPYTPDGSGNFSYSWNTLASPNGTYQVRVRGTDLAGNVNDNVSDSWTYYVDNGVPVISPIASPPVGPYVTSVVQVTFDYDAVSGLLATTGLAYYDSTMSSVIGSDFVTHTLGSPVATTTITTSVDTRDLPNGLHYLQAQATDHAANTGSTGYWPMDVCNRELQLTTITRISSIPPNGNVIIQGILVQNTSSGPQGPSGGPGWEIVVDVDNTVNGTTLPLSWQETFYVTDSSGTFSVTTTRDNLKIADQVVITVTNTDSGCATYFEANPPPGLIEKSISGTL